MKQQLSNCYTPLRKPGSTPASIQSRMDGRKPDEIRRITLDSAVFTDACGSSLVELGDTKVACKVHAPLTPTDPKLPKGFSPDFDQGTLCLSVKLLPCAHPESRILSHSAVPTENPKPKRIVSNFVREQEELLSIDLKTALSEVIPLQNYAKTAILIELQVLQDDGGVIPACLSAAVLALCDADIELLDVISACSVAETHQLLLVDPTFDELADASSTVSMAILPASKEACYWEQLGSSKKSNALLKLCREGCRTMQGLLTQHLVSRVLTKSSMETN